MIKLTKNIVLYAAFLFSAFVFANEELDKKLQDMQSTYDTMEKEKERKKHKEYLKNNDRENEISQRTGPYVEVNDGTPSAGYQWSTD